MQLSTYLDANGVTDAAFGLAIDVSRVAVGRYRRGLRVPTGAVMRRIAEATAGLVTANDFHQIHYASDGGGGGATGNGAISSRPAATHKPERKFTTPREAQAV